VEDQLNRTEDKRNPRDNSDSGPPSVESESLKPPIPVGAIKEVDAEQSRVHQEESAGNQKPADKSLADQIKKAERVMIWLTGIIAFATVINVIVFYFESESTTAQTVRLVEAAKGIGSNINTQGAATITAAGEQSKVALDASTEQNRLEQRAWIGPISIDKFSIDAGKPIVIRIQVSNSGRTPGLHCETVVRAKHSFRANPLYRPTREMTPPVL
jgi:hypothetical protein